MEQDKEKSPPSSAGCDTDRCEKRDNSAQKDERNEERKESFLKHKGSQRSVTEEGENAHCTIDPAEIAKRLSEVYDGLDPAVLRKSDFKQSKPSVASASVPPWLETSSGILQGSGAAEKQKQQMFPLKQNEPGSLSDSAELRHKQDIRLSDMSVPPLKLSRMMDVNPLLDSHRKSDFKQSKPSDVAASYPELSWLNPSFHGVPYTCTIPAGKQKIADEKFSEEEVQKKVPGHRVSSLPYILHLASPSWLSYQRKRGNISSRPVWSSKTEAEIVETQDQVLPSTTVHHDQDIRLSDMSVPPLKLSRMMDVNPLLDSHRKSDSKQSKPSIASASVPPWLETSNVILQGSRTAEKQKEQMFPIEQNEPGYLSDSAMFSAELMASLKGAKLESRRGSPAFSGPSSSAHLSSLSERTGPSDTTPSYYPDYRSFTNIIGESRQNDAFSVQSRNEPGVYSSFGGGMGSPVTAEQSLIRKKNAADESKPQSEVSSTSPVTSAEMLRDTLKDSTPGISVGSKCMNFAQVSLARRRQTLPSSPLHPTYAFNQSPSSVSPPASQPSFIHEQSEKQRTADDKFSEDKVQVELSSQSVGSLPHNSSIYGLHDYDRWDTHLINSTLFSPYHHHQQQQQQLQQQQLLLLLQQQLLQRQQQLLQQQQQQLQQLQQQQQKLLKRISFRPVYNRITKRKGEEKRNQVSPSTSVHHDPSISDPVLGNKVPQRKTIIPPVSVFSHSRKRVVPQGSSTAEKQKEQTFPIKRTTQRSQSEVSSAQSRIVKKFRKRALAKKYRKGLDAHLDQPPVALTETRMKIKSSSAAGDTTGARQDNTGGMEGVTGRSTLQPSTSNDDDLDFSLLADAFSPRSLQPESESGGDRDAHVEMESFVTAVNLSVTNTLPTHFHLLQTPDCFRSRRASSCLPRSHSVSSLCQTGSAENKILRRTQSLPNMLLKSSFVEFTPDITDDGNDESYRFLCSCPGLYQCSVTGLVFHMDGEGEVVYRIVPWNRRLLAQHHKQPAGPLFDIKCLQQSVCQLHLPHCEIRSTGGCEFLSVAHVHDEGIEFISPHQITDTHVIINITGFSGFGNVKDEDSPPDPVRALVLLFYKPPAAPDVTSLLNVLMLPGNVVLREVQRTRKNSKCEDEKYIETSSHCKLHPQREYTLSICPEDESVLVQPKEAEFYCENYDNYIPSFQVDIEKILKYINLFLRDSNKHSVWERRVCLSSTGVKRSRLQGESTERLLEIWSSFIDGISGPVLKSLLDRLFEKTVITDSERESADAIQVKRDKARFVIDTVRKKGEAASLEMIEYLCENDPFLCEHLGLI